MTEPTDRTDDDDFFPDTEGDCPTCDGTGEIVHSACEGSGCSRCSDGAVTCGECQGSGFRDEGRYGDDGEPLAMSDMIPW